jgi:citrate synthase
MRMVTVFFSNTAVYGNLPTKLQLSDWEATIAQHSAVPQGVLDIIAALPHDAHPMGMLIGSICTLSSFHADANPALQVLLPTHRHW